MPSFVSSLKVIYADNYRDAPEDAIKEFAGWRNDINFGFSGKYVWLVPNTTDDPQKAATGFFVAVQPTEEPTQQDMAKGAGGDFRYQIPTEMSGQPKIVEVGLLRAVEGPRGIPAGWDGISANINEGREGFFLAIIWRCERA